MNHSSTIIRRTTCARSLTPFAFWVARSFDRSHLLSFARAAFAPTSSPLLLIRSDLVLFSSGPEVASLILLVPPTSSQLFPLPPPAALPVDSLSWPFTLRFPISAKPDGTCCQLALLFFWLLVHQQGSRALFGSTPQIQQAKGPRPVTALLAPYHYHTWAWA